jgi:hypothetical protein
MAFNNTYGYQAYNQSVYEAALDAFTQPDGCADLIHVCRQAAAEGDPSYNGNNMTVNDLCEQAFDFCFLEVQAPINISGVRTLSLDI